MTLTNPKPKATVAVVAAIIRNQHNDILLARRAQHAHQGGLWEFPGGKIESGELPTQALQRELKEELGIRGQLDYPLITIQHDYADKSVQLDVWQVRCTDVAYGKEGQDIRWIKAHELNNYTFPAANQGIVKAALLPDHYAISPDLGNDDNAFLNAIDHSLQHGIKLLQLRLADANAYARVLPKVLQLCQAQGTDLYLNSNVLHSHITIPSQCGIHLKSSALASYSANTPHRLAASCHHQADIQRANALKTEFMVLSPVKTSSSHPEAQPMNWLQFWQLSQYANSPIYALGGLQTQQLDCARAHGAQGIAGITCYFT